MTAPHGGMNRRELDKMFRAMGGTITPVHRTGELIYTHPLFPTERPRANARRKDAPRHLVVFARKVAARQAELLRRALEG